MALSANVKAAVATDNLLHCSKEEKINVQKRLSHLSDIAHITADRLISSVAQHGNLREALAEQGEAVDGMLARSVPGTESNRMLEFMTRRRLSFDKICITDMLLSRLSRHNMFDIHMFAEGPCGGSVGYVRHRGTDMVFCALEDVLGGLTVSYAADLREACGEVASGQCDYAILPTAEAGGSGLSSVLSMIRRHELKVCAEYSDETHTYAVVSRTVRTVGDTGDTLLSVRFDDAKAFELALQAAEAHGHSTCSLSSYTEGEVRYTEAVFSARQPEDFGYMLLLLSLFSPTAVICGIYHHIIL